MSAGPPGDSAAPPRCLNVSQATAVVVGNMIGVGIFLLPGLVARHTQTTTGFLLAWALGGLWSLSGALCLGELGAMLPRAGGDYAYLHEAYGRRWAFVYGWLSLLVTFPGSLAVMATLTLRYQGPTLFGDAINRPLLELAIAGGHWSLSPAELGAVAVLAVLTLLNHLTTRGSGWGQLGITLVAALLIVLGAVGVASVAAGGGAALASRATPEGQLSLGGLGLALLPVYFAYAGWNAAAYLGGEVERPARTLPWALLLGTGLVTVVYLLVCVAYIQALPVATMAETFSVGGAAAEVLLGSRGGAVLNVLIIVAVLGSLNATVLTGSRVLYAMSRDGLLFARVGHLHPRHRTPTVALWLQFAWAALLVLAGKVEPVLDYTVSAMLLLSVATVLAVPVLRWRRPELERPFRLPLYPLAPLLYATISAVVLSAALRQPPVYAPLVGLGLAAVGLLVYRLGPGRPHPPR